LILEKESASQNCLWEIVFAGKAKQSDEVTASAAWRSQS